MPRYGRSGTRSKSIRPAATSGRLSIAARAAATSGTSKTSTASGRSARKYNLAQDVGLVQLPNGLSLRQAQPVEPGVVGRDEVASLSQHSHWLLRVTAALVPDRP